MIRYCPRCVALGYWAPLTENRLLIRCTRCDEDYKLDIPRTLPAETRNTEPVVITGLKALLDTYIE